jgi:hypothetical protein
MAELKLVTSTLRTAVNAGSTVSTKLDSVSSQIS